MNRTDPQVSFLHHGLFTKSEVSRMSYNTRLLEEANDVLLPIPDRLHFFRLCILDLQLFYDSHFNVYKNLSRIENPRLKSLIRGNPTRQLTHLKKLVDDREKLLQDSFEGLDDAVQKEGLRIITRRKDIPTALFPDIRKEFEYIQSALQPVIIKNYMELEPGQPYLFLKVQHIDSEYFFDAYVNIPANNSRLNHFEIEGNRFALFLDDIIRINLKKLFPGYKVSEAFSVTYHVCTTSTGRYLTGTAKTRVENALKRRSPTPSRLLYDKELPLDMVSSLIHHLDLRDEDVQITGRYHQLEDIHQLTQFDGFCKQQIKSLRKKSVDVAKSILAYLDHDDLLLHLPYQSGDYVARFLREAAVDPEVKTITAVVKEVLPDGFVFSTLAGAAKSGINVLVSVQESSVTTDELSKAGAEVFVASSEFHIQAELVLVKKKSNQNLNYALVGTGAIESYSSSRAQHVLMTGHFALTRELRNIFDHFTKQKKLHKQHHVLVNALKTESLFPLIEREMENVKTGKKGHIFLKVPFLEDPALINKLYEANLAGVTIVVLIHSSTTILPQMQPFSTNIKVYRLVDTFIENSSVLVFQNGGVKKVFLGSENWQTSANGIDLLYPVFDKRLQRELIKYLAFQLNDNSKLRILDEHMNNNPILRKHGAQRIRAQVHIKEWLETLGNQGND